MDKRILLSLGCALTLSTVSAETFRVNNAGGSGAQYSTYKDAEAAASDGDVIIIDGSEKSYGTIEITKKITLKGPGYFLKQNGISSEGASSATFDEIFINAEGAKVTGVVCEGYLNMRADNIVVTRCAAKVIKLCADFSYTDKHISHGVIHQNYIYNGISGDSYSGSATYMQVTNNIISYGYNAMFCNMDNSLISRNTAVSNESGVRQLTNCVIENNIGVNIENDYWANKDNTYSNNYDLGTYNGFGLYGQFSVDSKIQEVDATIATDKGAFSGDDPYVISGLPSGPIITDVTMPESVVKGEDLKVTVKIGVSK